MALLLTNVTSAVAVHDIPGGFQMDGNTSVQANANQPLDWESVLGKAPKGRFQGVAQIMGYGSYVAAVAEVSVSGGCQ